MKDITGIKSLTCAPSLESDYGHGLDAGHFLMH